jgi:hypothetical protein
MKTASLKGTNSKGENPGFHFDFRFCPAEDSASITTWEEENSEYTSWNLIIDPQDAAKC